MTGKTGFTEFILNWLKSRINEPGIGEAVYTYLAYNHLAMKSSMPPRTPAEYIQIVSHNGILPPPVIAFTIENYKDPMIDLHKYLRDPDKILNLLEKHAPYFIHRLTSAEIIIRVPVKERDENYKDYRRKYCMGLDQMDTYNAYIFRSDLRLLQKNADTYFWMAHYKSSLISRDWFFSIERTKPELQEPKPTKTKPRLRIIEGSKK